MGERRARVERGPTWPKAKQANSHEPAAAARLASALASCYTPRCVQSLVAGAAQPQVFGLRRGASFTSRGQVVTGVAGHVVLVAP